MSRVALPVDDVIPQLLSAFDQHNSAVLRAPTGAGKTTRVPPALLESGLIGNGQIVMLEPRRLAARAAARRMAQEGNDNLGNTVGYHVRFDRKSSQHTRILTVTPGILLRMLQEDPFLEAVGAVLFDEFHERGLEPDVALGMVRLLQQTVRPDMRILVMSATIAVEPIAKYLDNCPVIISEGRLHPVEIRYEPPSRDRPSPNEIARAVEHILNLTDGDVLVFLPGLAEIRQSAEELEFLATEHNLTVLPLYGDLSPQQQDAALLPLPQRKIVLATNVAETSVTVEGITGVVDSGLERSMQFDPGTGLDRLSLVPISKASADQRSGRAGRTRPGVCIRLWGEMAHRARPEQTLPEVQRVDPVGALLHLLSMGESDVKTFPWLEAPKTHVTDQAMTLLRSLGAIDDRGLTSLGQEMARLPLHPRLSRLLLAGQHLQQPHRAALAAALLSERDPFPRRHDRADRTRHDRTDSDILDRIEALEEFENHGRVTFSLGTLQPGSARNILRVRDQLLRELGLSKTNPYDRDNDALLRALLTAFPDRVARRREPGSVRGVMVGGRGVKLALGSGVTEAELFLCVDVDAGDTEALVRQASAIRKEWLPEADIREQTDLSFDTEAEKVTAVRRTYYDSLVLQEAPAKLSDGDETTKILLDAALQSPDKVLPAEDSPAGRFVQRWQCLRNWIPDLDLPTLETSDWQEVLGYLCQGCRSFADLRRADWLGILQGRLSHQQLQTLEREAPERIQVPSGSRLVLQYRSDGPPILAVRIQELFGLTETPRIASGRIPVLLHLLAPNYRPQQVTDDLAGFWVNTYPQVRKDLRGRYPKHAWPEDPTTAMPVHRPRRKPK